MHNRQDANSCSLASRQEDVLPTQRLSSLTLQRVLASCSKALQLVASMSAKPAKVRAWSCIKMRWFCSRLTSVANSSEMCCSNASSLLSSAPRCARRDASSAATPDAALVLVGDSASPLASLACNCFTHTTSL